MQISDYGLGEWAPQVLAWVSVMALASVVHSGTSCSLAEAALVGDGVMAKSTLNCIKECSWSLAAHGSESGSA